MNKTININLGKVFFHIDEKAYEVLKKIPGCYQKTVEASRRSGGSNARY